MQHTNNWQPRTCIECGATYQPTSWTQKRCPEHVHNTIHSRRIHPLRTTDISTPTQALTNKYIQYAHTHPHPHHT